MRTNWFIIGIIASTFFFGCKSTYEKQGDAHLKEARPFQALQRYAYVVKAGNGSADFDNNLTKAYIGALEISVMKGAEPHKLSVYRGKISELLEKNPNEETGKLYSDAASKIAKILGANDDFISKEIAFKFLQDVEKNSFASPGAKATISELKTLFINKTLETANEYLESCLAGAAEDGIVADYTLAEASLLLGNSDGLDSLWSKVRKANLSNYLMYDFQGLISSPHPSINKFGVLLAVRTIKRAGKNVSFQIQAYNGSSNHVQFLGENLTLLDREGNEYKTVKKGGDLAKKKLLMAGQESGVGTASFVVPKDAELDFLKLETESGQSMKWLP